MGGKDLGGVCVVFFFFFPVGVLGGFFLIYIFFVYIIQGRAGF